MGGRPLGTRPWVCSRLRREGHCSGPRASKVTQVLGQVWALAAGHGKTRRPGGPDSWAHRALGGVGCGCRAPGLGQ